MKKIVLLVYIIFQWISCELVCAQQESLISKDSNKRFKLGLGIDILNFNRYGEGLRGGFILPVDIYQYRIEPEINFNREKSKVMLKKEYSIGLSCYRLVDFKIINLLPGITVRHENLKQEYDQYCYNIKSTSFGPIIGAEYFFINNFSIGVNFGLIFELLEDTDRNDNTTNYKNIYTDCGLRIRFYFL